MGNKHSDTKPRVVTPSQMHIRPGTPNQVVRRLKLSDRQKRILAAKQKYRCNICKMTLTENWEIDHKVALARGGDNSPDNFQVLCVECHASKSYLDLYPERYAVVMGEPELFNQTPTPTPTPPRSPQLPQRRALSLNELDKYKYKPPTTQHAIAITSAALQFQKLRI